MNQDVVSSPAVSVEGKGKSPVVRVPEWTYADNAFAHVETGFAVELVSALKKSGCIHSQLESVVSRIRGMEVGAEDSGEMFWVPVNDQNQAFKQDGAPYRGGKDESRIDVSERTLNDIMRSERGEHSQQRQHQPRPKSWMSRLVQGLRPSAKIRPGIAVTEDKEPSQTWMYVGQSFVRGLGEVVNLASALRSSDYNDASTIVSLTHDVKREENAKGAFLWVPSNAQGESFNEFAFPYEGHEGERKVEILESTLEKILQDRRLKRYASSTSALPPGMFSARAAKDPRYKPRASEESRLPSQESDRSSRSRSRSRSCSRS